MTTEALYEQIWKLSPSLPQPEAASRLTQLTKALIDLYTAQGRLDQNPFEPSISRVLSVPFAEINQKLANSICLVTGGLGCVGTILVNELLKYNVQQIIVLDIASPPPDKPADNRIVYVQCDINNEAAVSNAFAQHQPQFVFHTAAERSPGYAERHAFHTFQTNVIGSFNIANACERTESVKQCVFSSTGKASRYFTNEVYAQTKKFCEYIFDTYAQTGRVLYSMARFTHIIDNSLMNEELETDSRLSDHLAIHSPGKYVTAQNAKEAAVLLLNGLLHAEKGRCRFLIVKNLEWPVESLEVALYYIKISNRNIPVIFKGNPPGYIEKFFRGQLDWSHPDELNLLINVYEYKYRKYNAEGDILISRICPVSKNKLVNAIEGMRYITDEQKLKQALTLHLQTLVSDSLNDVDKKDTVKILTWGLHPKYLSIEKATVKDYGLTVPILTDSLQGTTFFSSVSHLLAEEATVSADIVT